MKRFSPILIFILLSYAVVAQEPAVHKKTTFVDSTGQFYIQKSLPIYLWISTSPSENADKTRLQSQSCKAYTNPLYLDTEGYNTVRTPSKVDTITKKAIVPKEDIIFEIYADSQSPKTKVTAPDSKFHWVGGKKIVKGNLKIILVARDALSGLQSIYYSLNGAAYVHYSEPIVLNDEKEYTLKYYSVDNVGNAEEPKTEHFIIDKTSPQGKVSVLGGYDGNVLSGKARIKLEFDDNGSGMKNISYSVDNSKWYTYSEPVYVNWLNEGKHRFHYKAEDKVGNVSEDAVYEFFVDKTPPKIIDELIGDIFYLNGKEYVSGRTQLKLTAIDNKAGVDEVYYSFNGNDYLLYTKPVDVPSGSKTMAISFYALDKVGNNNKNSSKAASSRMSYTDMSGPRLDFKFASPYYQSRDTFFISSKSKVNLKAYDAETQVKNIEYRLNSGGKQLFETAFTVEKEGLNMIEYWGADMLNNTNKGTFEFIVDNSGPEIFERFSSLALSERNGKQVYPSNITLFLSATDAKVGYMKMQYSINGSALQAFTGSITGFTKNAEIAVKVLAFDKLGNQTEKLISFITGE